MMKNLLTRKNASLGLILAGATTFAYGWYLPDVKMSDRLSTYWAQTKEMTDVLERTNLSNQDSSALLNVLLSRRIEPSEINQDRKDYLEKVKEKESKERYSLLGGCILALGGFYLGRERKSNTLK